MQKVEDMQAWEREERSRVQKMKVGELKDMLQALDEQTADLQKMQGLQL
jgi:hypothetical protein